MSADLLKIDGISKSFERLLALDGFSASVAEGEILGLIGPNGAGKTTLFNVLTGFIRADGGRTRYKNNDITRLAPHKVAQRGIARTFQIVRLIRQISVLDNILLCFRDQAGERIENLFFRRKKWRAQEEANVDRALALLGESGIGDKAGHPAEDLSYGQQKLLSLICCRAADADLILLDEPVAGIAPEMIDRILGIIKELAARGKSVIIIEHNIDAVMQVSDRLIFMDAGKKVSEGAPEEVRNDPRVIEAYLD